MVENLTNTATLDLEAVDVTNTRSLNARGVQFATPVRDVTRAFASRMELPSGTPWALRNDRTGAILDEDRPIGDEIESGSRVVLTPRSHLGCAA